MAQGLQIFDAVGNITLDTNTSTVKIIAKFETTEETQTITNNLFITETPFFIITPQFRYTSSDLNVTFSGNTCTIINTNKYSRKTVYIGVM